MDSPPVNRVDCDWLRGKVVLVAQEHVGAYPVNRKGARPRGDTQRPALGNIAAGSYSQCARDRRKTQVNSVHISQHDVLAACNGHGAKIVIIIEGDIIRGACVQRGCSIHKQSSKATVIYTL